jgi:cytochrome b561
MRRSSSVLSGGWETTLKKRTILRGWKLQFIPSDYSYRRTIAVCSVLLLACILVLVTTGLVIYMTTGQQIFSFPFSFKLYSCSF